MLKASIVGCGGIANVHANMLAKMKNAKLLSVADSKVERAESYANLFACKPYNNLHELIEADKPDILHICTPHYTHAPLAYYAMSKGINVLLEKPLCISTSELAVLKNAFDKKNLLFGVCYQNRYNPSTLIAKKYITDGSAGKIKGIRAFVTWKREAEYYGIEWRGAKITEGGGVMINQAIHTLDLCHWFVGREPVYTDGTISNNHLKGIIGVEDAAQIYMDYGDGLKGIFYATTAYSTDKDILIDIECENMSIRLEANKIYIYHEDGRVEVPEVSDIDAAFGKSYWGDGHEALISDFYKCAESKAKFGIDMHEASKAIKTILELYSN